MSRIPDQPLALWIDNEVENLQGNLPDEHGLLVIEFTHLDPCFAILHGQ